MFNVYCHEETRSLWSWTKNTWATLFKVNIQSYSASYTPSLDACIDRTQFLT